MRLPFRTSRKNTLRPWVELVLVVACAFEGMAPTPALATYLLAIHKAFAQVVIGSDAYCTIVVYYHMYSLSMDRGGKAMASAGQCGAQLLQPTTQLLGFFTTGLPFSSSHS